MIKIFFLCLLLEIIISQKNFQVISPLSISRFNEDTLKNYTVSPNFLLQNNILKYSSLYDENVNKTSSLLSKIPINSDSFELHLTLNFTPIEKSDGIFFGVFFLNKYHESSFDLTKNFTGFAITFTKTNINNKMGRDDGKIEVKLYKNSENKTAEDLLINESYEQYNCNEREMIGQRFKAYITLDHGYLTIQYDLPRRLYMYCFRKDLSEFKRKYFKLALVTFEGKNFYQKDPKDFIFRSNIDIFKIRLLNMEKRYKERFYPNATFVEEKEIDKKYVLDSKLIDKCIDLLDSVNFRVRILRKEKDKRIYEKEKRNKFMEELGKSREDLTKAISEVNKLFNLTMETKNETDIVTRQKAFFQANFDNFVDNCITERKANEIVRKLDNTLLTLKNVPILLKALEEAIDKEDASKEKTKEGKADL